MAVSLYESIRENSRERETNDDRFFKSYPWIFRIVADGKGNIGPLGDDGTATFMLPINPSSFRYSLPLASEVTPQMSGGVIAEEDGIILGSIEMTGSTGFKLRHPQMGKNKLINGEFTGTFSENSQVIKQPISGHLHFWLLANQLIEGYSFLKKHPETNHARMELHILKDQLHLHVIPRTFDLQRSATSETVSYRYTMRLDVVGPAKPFELPPPSERGLKEKITDAIRETRNAVQGIQATLVDLKASIDEYRRIAGSVASVITDVESIMNAASDLVDGAADVMNVPKQFIDNTTSLVQSTAEFMADVLTLPADVAASFLSLGDNLDALKVACRDSFSDAWDATVAAYGDLTDEGKAIEPSDEIIDEYTRENQQSKFDDAMGSQGTWTSLDVFGGGIRPGDAIRPSSQENRIKLNQVNGFKEVVLSATDSLESLAARHLGDASRWIEIAIANDLEAPYISLTDGIPKTLQRGDRIIIPQMVSSPFIPEIIASQGNADGQSQVASVLGKEFRLKEDPLTRQISWTIDDAGGKVDIQTVDGLDNLSQGLMVRLSTEKGEDITYPSLGMPRAIGVSQLVDTTSSIVFSVREELLADPRIEKVVKLDVNKTGDAVELSAHVQPKGFSTSLILKRRVA